MPAGEGDGELLETLTALRDDGYTGFASLEPHLADPADPARTGPRVSAWAAGVRGARRRRGDHPALSLSLPGCRL